MERRARCRSALVLAQCGAVRQPDDDPAYVEPPLRDAAGLPKGAALVDVSSVSEVVHAVNVYAATMGGLAPSADFTPRVYVPNEKVGQRERDRPRDAHGRREIKVGTYPQHKNDRPPRD